MKARTCKRCDGRGYVIHTHRRVEACQECGNNQQRSN